MGIRDRFRRKLNTARKREFGQRPSPMTSDHRKKVMIEPVLAAIKEIKKELSGEDYLVWKLRDDTVGVDAPIHGDKIEVSVGVWATGRAYFRVLTNSRDETYKTPEEAVDRFMDELSEMIASIELINGGSKAEEPKGRRKGRAKSASAR